jgi:hypothetical protein
MLQWSITHDTKESQGETEGETEGVVASREGYTPGNSLYVAVSGGAGGSGYGYAFCRSQSHYAFGRLMDIRYWLARRLHIMGLRILRKLDSVGRKIDPDAYCKACKQWLVLVGRPWLDDPEWKCRNCGSIHGHD